MVFLVMVVMVTSLPAQEAVALPLLLSKEKRNQSLKILLLGTGKLMAE